MSHWKLFVRHSALWLAFVMMAPALAQNDAPNPYRTVENWAKLPDGRVWGATSAVYPANDGKHIWIAERCGANLCVGSDVDPVMLFDQDGNVVRSFGAGMIVWPHGIFVDADDNVWIADSVGYAPVPEGIGHTIMKFSPDGELLMRLGKRASRPTDRQSSTSLRCLSRAKRRHIRRRRPRCRRQQPYREFSKDGEYLMEWGTAGSGVGEFQDPHALAMDSQGRLFVGDRANSRIQLFDQEGNYLETWTQFGRPSGLYIDENDILYSADSESNATRNRGWKRGIRIGSAKDGFVTEFIPDPEPDQDNSGTSAAEGVAVDATATYTAPKLVPAPSRSTCGASRSPVGSRTDLMLRC